MCSLPAAFVVRAGSRLDEPQRAADPLRERPRPRSLHDAAADRATVEIDRDRLAEHDLAGGDGAVGEPKREVLALAVVLRPHPHELAVPDLVVTATARVDDVEATVLGHAGL